MTQATTIHTKNTTPASGAVSEEARLRSAGPARARASGEPASVADPAIEASAAAPAPQARVTKLRQIQAQLAAPAGVNLATLCDATGWQSHSVRAALTRLRRAGAVIEKAKVEDGTTVYRTAAGAEDAT